MIVYDEFETTVGSVVDALAAKILTHPSWTEITPAQVATTITAATGTSSTSTTWAVSSTAGMYVGQTLIIGAGTANETARIVTSVNSATSVTIAGGNMPVSFASGTSVISKLRLLKATNAAGQDLIIGLAGHGLNYMTCEFYREHGGTSTTDFTDMIMRYLYWRSSATGALASHPVHLVASVSSEHLFVSAEGPRGYEAGPTHVTYGSAKNYIFIDTLVPYHAADLVPAVVAHGSIQASPTASTAQFSHQANISRDSQDSESWQAARLGTITFPSLAASDQITLERASAIDAKKYVFPYVVFSRNEGMRGRLKRLFYAGANFTTLVEDSPVSPGELMTMEGVTYKFVAVSGGDGSSSTYWGALGAVANNGTSTSQRSPVVAVPYQEA